MTDDGTNDVILHVQEYLPTGRYHGTGTRREGGVVPRTLQSTVWYPPTPPALVGVYYRLPLKTFRNVT